MRSDEELMNESMDEHDDVLQRARAALAPLPPANPAAVARILAAVRSDAGADVQPLRLHRETNRESHRESHRETRGEPRRSNRSPQRRWFAGAAILAAAAVVAVVLRGTDSTAPNGTDSLAVTARGDAPTVVAVDTNLSATGDETPYPAVLVPATEDASMEAVPVFFGFVGSARTVALVGDFNGWDADSMPLTRVDGTDRWVTSARIVPGRHVYAFVVDGARWVRDPSAPQAPDDDFGKPGSVLMVTPQ